MKALFIGGPHDGVAEVDRLQPVYSFPGLVPPPFPSISDYARDGSIITHTYLLERVRAENPVRDIYAYVHESERRPLTRKIEQQVVQRECDLVSWKPGVQSHEEIGHLFGYPLIKLSDRLPTVQIRKDAFYELRGMVFGYSVRRYWVFIGQCSNFLGEFTGHESDYMHSIVARIEARQRASNFVHDQEYGEGQITEEPGAIAKAFRFLYRFLTNPEDLGPAMDRAEEDGLISKDERPENHDRKNA